MIEVQKRLKTRVPLAFIARKFGYTINWQPEGKALPAMVNHGRWIVKCPTCNGAELVDPDMPIFFCYSCGNESNGGHVYPVSFPQNWREIEAALIDRPPANQNWLPGETIEDLRNENEENKL